jgi:hypothetical protein
VAATASTLDLLGDDGGAAPRLGEAAAAGLEPSAEAVEDALREVERRLGAKEGVRGKQGIGLSEVLLGLGVAGLVAAAVAAGGLASTLLAGFAAAVLLVGADLALGGGGR